MSDSEQFALAKKLQEFYFTPKINTVELGIKIMNVVSENSHANASF